MNMQIRKVAKEEYYMIQQERLFAYYN